MAMQYRYENQNPWPIVVPGKGGIGTQFAPGQWTTDTWYSRFCGNAQLTRVATAEADVVPLPAPKVAAPVQHVPPPEMLAAIQGAAEEATDHWTKKAGIYHCAHCDLFRTGSALAMQSHVTTYHKLEVTVPVTELEPVAPVVEDVVVEPSKESPDIQIDSPEESETVTRTPVKRDTGDEVFTCRHCGRSYRSDDGLQEHMGREHSA